MGNPEVTSFPAPEQNHFFKELRDGTTLDKFIQGHSFNSKVLLFVPKWKDSMEEMELPLKENSWFYTVKDLNVAELCSYPFVQAFVQQGFVYAFTSGTRLDIDISVAFHPCGILYILLDEEHYQELGIPGRLSKNILRKPKLKYVIEINTLNPAFNPSSHLYQRIHKCLQMNPLCLDFSILWVPADKNICPSSVGSYFHNRGYMLLQNQTRCKEIYNQVTLVPRWCPQTFNLPVRNVDNASIDSCSAEQNITKSVPDSTSHSPSSHNDDILEWYGLHALGITATLDILPNMKQKDSSFCGMVIHDIVGFFPPSALQKVIHCAKEYVMKDSVSHPWIGITVYGPQDCLISWGKKEHAFRTNGDNFYHLIVFKDTTWAFTVEGSTKPERYVCKSAP